MVRDKVVLKKAGLDFWKVGVRMIKYNGFPLACAQKTHVKLGEISIVHVPRNSRHEGM